MHSLSSYKGTAEHIADKGYARINLFLDNNESGDKATMRFIEDFGDKIISHTPSFGQHEDLNDVLRARAGEGFQPFLER